MQSSHNADGGPSRQERASETPGGEQPESSAGSGAAAHADTGTAGGPLQDARGGGGPADPGGELSRIEDRYKRALADLDNYRKRAGREIDRRVAEAREDVLREWLAVLDSVERALVMDPHSACADGLRAVLQQIDGVLEREGASRIGRPGDQFDPERHEAVAVRTSAEVPDRTVVEVHRSGVTRGERVLRPAQVVVARAPEHAR
jgi:molecular chaperone GrpE